MILFGPLSVVPDAIKEHAPSHLVSLLDQEKMIDTPAAIQPRRHLRLVLNDIAEPTEGLVAPARHHVSQLIDFVLDWDQRSPLLIHCWIGISRSTAAAFIALCALNKNHSEDAIAKLLRETAPHAAPNPAMIDIADDILARRGRMRKAIKALGPTDTVYGHLAALPPVLPILK